MMFRLTPVVKFVLIVIIAMYLLTLACLKLGFESLPYYLILHPYDSNSFKPFQIFTYMLMHDFSSFMFRNDFSSFMHIFFNMFMFVTFGPQLEEFLGSKRFGNFIIISGLGVGACWLIWNQLIDMRLINMVHSESGGMLGFSGVLMGIFALMGLYFPDRQVMLLIPPMPVKLKWLVLVYIAFEFYSLVKTSNDHVSHISHLLGVLFAVIMYNIWHYIDSNRA